MNEQRFSFDERERAFFSAKIAEINRLMQAVTTAVQLVTVQYELPGEWELNLDGSGLTRTK